MNGTLFLQDGQKLFGQFKDGRPFGEGVHYDVNGNVVSSGPWGLEAEDQNSGSSDSNSSNSFLPKMSDLGLNLTDNKYTNLLRMISDFLGIKWPF